jgi:hypothetical protein
MTVAAHTRAASRLERQQWRQLAWITAGALVIFFGLRLLPTGTNLSHMDFRVDPKAGNAIEFCDPLNPQFIPVVAARSPVIMTVMTAEPATAGQAIRATVKLQTASGKPLAPEDLLYTHTRRLHLLIIDPRLRDYQHVHPDPTRTPGEWAFTFTPHASGAYRIFSDFTPAATGRGLYASADLDVRGAVGAAKVDSEMPAMRRDSRGAVEREGHAFLLTTMQQPARAGQPLDLRFAVSRLDGAPVVLQPVMDALAHLVAFDRARSGFAHLHPSTADLSNSPDGRAQILNFKLTIPRAGPYVIWAQVNLGGGRETFVPFDLEVVE